MKRITFILFSLLLLVASRTYAQESRILKIEQNSTPLFILSHFAKENCKPLKINSYATWNITLKQGNKSVTYKEDKPHNALFEIVEDRDSTYDCSIKKYEIKTKDFTLEYKYYAYSDALKIIWQGVTYQISTIDGACDVHLGQLCQRFRIEDKKETLVLYVLDDMTLTKDGRAKAPSITLAKGSILAISVKI